MAGHGRERRLALGLCAVAAVGLVLLTEHGSFARFGAQATAHGALPDITLGDGSDRMPVVTSIRSDGIAERAGIQVGDEIAAIGDRPVHDVAGLRAAVLAHRGDGPLALHIRRGDALRTIALDRAAPAAGPEKLATRGLNGAENPAD